MYTGETNAHGGLRTQVHQGHMEAWKAHGGLKYTEGYTGTLRDTRAKLFHSCSFTQYKNTNTLFFAFALLISREKTPEARPYSVALALRITPSISLQDGNKPWHVMLKFKCNWYSGEQGGEGNHR